RKSLVLLLLTYLVLLFMARKKRRTGVGGPRAVPEDPDFDIVDRDEAGQPDLTEAQRKRKASGEARAARSRDNTFHARKAKLAHLTDHLPQALWDAFLDKAVRPRVKDISERGVIGSLLLGFLVRGLFTLHVANQLDAQGQPLSYTDTDIPVSAADIPDLSCRNLFLQLCRGLPGDGEGTQPSAAVAAVLAAHPDLCARLEAIPRHLSDTNMVDHVGKQLETAFSNMLTLLFAGRLKKSVSLAGAKVLLGTNEHQRRFGVRGLVGGHLPAWSKRQCTYVRRMVCGLEVTWLVGEGGMVVTAAMQAEVALQRGLLGLGEGEKVDDDWVEDPANRGRLLRHAVHTTREVEAAMAAWQLDMVPWEQAEPTNLVTRPPRPPTPYALTPTSKCQARHIFIDTRGLYGLISDAGMLGVLTEQGVTSLNRFRNGALPDPARPGHYIEGPPNSKVAAASEKHGKAFPSPGPDVLNKHQQHHQAEVQRLRDVEQSLMGTVDGLQGDLGDLQAAHQSLQGTTPELAEPAGAPPQQQQQLAAASTSRKRGAPAANKSRAAKQGATHNSVAKRASAARLAFGPGPRPTELCYWTNRPAMPKPGQPGQDWVEIPDKPWLRKWQRQLQQ
ncbi:hypothetical protein QJQ45_021395, partial [Haematococcus lacustris]